MFSSATGCDFEVTFNFIMEDEKEKRQAQLADAGNCNNKFVGKLKKDIEDKVENLLLSNATRKIATN